MQVAYNPSFDRPDFQHSYPPVSWIPRISVSPQPFDDHDGPTDDKVTRSAPVRAPQRILRRSAAALTDPRRAPVVSPTSRRSSDSARPARRPPVDSVARHYPPRNRRRVALSRCAEEHAVHPGVYSDARSQRRPLYVGKRARLRAACRIMRILSGLSTVAARMLAETACDRNLCHPPLG